MRTTEDVVTRALGTMTLDQRVGQLFMVGGPATGVGAATRTAVTRYHVGNLMRTGRSAAGVTATAKVVSGMRSRTTRQATSGVPLLVATDQEGGAVQALRGKGFSVMPSIDLNLAPVADTVPSLAAARGNAPIGRFARELGLRPDDVAAHAGAFTQAMADGASPRPPSTSRGWGGSPATRTSPVGSLTG